MQYSVQLKTWPSNAARCMPVRAKIFFISYILWLFGETARVQRHKIRAVKQQKKAIGPVNQKFRRIDSIFNRFNWVDCETFVLAHT